LFTNLLAARTQMGVSFFFHIIFAVLGVGWPVLLCFAEGLALLRKNASLLALARQWTRAFAILFAIGAVSGTIVEFEISLVWPPFADQVGAIIGLPFATEGFAFFMEGIFLGLYLYGWGRLAPRVLYIDLYNDNVRRVGEIVQHHATLSCSPSIVMSVTHSISF
jgi:cytochrome bd ubiquinol oxidase subunit I